MADFAARIGGAASADHYRIMTSALRKHNPRRSPVAAIAMPNVGPTRHMDDCAKAIARAAISA
jgi:hypothetical protein